MWKKVKEIGYKKILAIVIAVIVIAILYSYLVGINLVVSFMAILLAIGGSYYIFSSFYREERPPELKKGERILVKTLDGGYVLFPKKRKGLLGKEVYRNLDIYLTNERIIAREKGEDKLEIPIKSIKEAKVKGKFMNKMVRLVYRKDDEEDEALIYPGDVDLWMRNLEAVRKK